MIKLIRSIVSSVVLLAIAVGLYSTVMVPNDYRDCGLDMKGCKKSDVIVVLSGGDTQARANYGVNLYRMGIAPKILFVGAAAQEGVDSNAKTMETIATNSGVPVNDVIIEEKSRNTCENAKLAKDIIEERGFKEITLVTSAYHQHRALGEFKKNLDIEKHTIYNAPLVEDKDWSSSWYLTPNSWWLATKEFFGWFRQLAGWSC